MIDYSQVAYTCTCMLSLAESILTRLLPISTSEAPGETSAMSEFAFACPSYLVA